MEKEGKQLTPRRLARSWVKTIQPTAAAISSTNRTMKKVPMGLTIFGSNVGCSSGTRSCRV